MVRPYYRKSIQHPHPPFFPRPQEVTVELRVLFGFHRKRQTTERGGRGGGGRTPCLFPADRLKTEEEETHSSALSWVLFISQLLVLFLILMKGEAQIWSELIQVQVTWWIWQRRWGTRRTRTVKSWCPGTPPSWRVSSWLWGWWGGRPGCGPSTPTSALAWPGGTAETHTHTHKIRFLQKSNTSRSCSV